MALAPGPNHRREDTIVDADINIINLYPAEYLLLTKIRVTRLNIFVAHEKR